MRHPVRSDFDTAMTDAGVNVTFKPTNSIYSFHRLPESGDVTRLGSVSSGVCPAEPRGYTEDYLSDEVQNHGAARGVRSRRVGLVSSRRGRDR